MDYPKSYGKRPLWQWLVIYLIIGGLIYAAAYYFFFAKKGATPYEGVYDPRSALLFISVTPIGFQPNSITIKAGETVTWNNQSGATISINSAPHPTHSDYPPLNLGSLDNGHTVTLSFPTTGTYKYHNHLNPSQFGSITVQ